MLHQKWFQTIATVQYVQCACSDVLCKMYLMYSNRNFLLHNVRFHFFCIISTTLVFLFKIDCTVYRPFKEKLSWKRRNKQDTKFNLLFHGNLDFHFEFLLKQRMTMDQKFRLYIRSRAKINHYTIRLHVPCYCIIICSQLRLLTYILLCSDQGNLLRGIDNKTKIATN